MRCLNVFYPSWSNIPRVPPSMLKERNCWWNMVSVVVVSLSWECWHCYALWTYKEVKWPQGVIMTISSSNPPLSFSNLKSQYSFYIVCLGPVTASQWALNILRYRNIVLANHLITAINYWLMWSFKFLWIQRFILRSLGTDKEGSSKQELSQIIINCHLG